MRKLITLAESCSAIFGTGPSLSASGILRLFQRLGVDIVHLPGELVHYFALITKVLSRKPTVLFPVITYLININDPVYTSFVGLCQNIIEDGGTIACGMPIQVTLSGISESRFSRIPHPQ